MTRHAQSPYRLTVEGLDDKHSIIHLMKRHGYAWDAAGSVQPHVQEAGSWEQALGSIPAAAKTYERAGVVIDADSDLSSRWQAVRGRLHSVGYSPPDSLPADGLVLSASGLARFGVWLMPNNVLTGRLEDFLAELVPPNDPCWPLAQASTTSAQQSGARLPVKDHIRGSLHAWLAWQDPPGMAFGTAITALVFQHNTAQASAFVRWFRDLFEAP